MNLQIQNEQTLYDAHAHLPEPLNRDREAGKLSSASKHSVVNGTSPTDWSAVLEFARKHPQILPAIGLHPHSVREAPNDWKETFLKLLDTNSVCAIGEIGLDRRDPHKETIEPQLDAFRWQLEQAYIRNLPVSIHCVKATGLLMEKLRSKDLPTRGMHLHAYAGSVELIPELVKLGAYFSFSARQLAFENTNVQNRIRAVPTERLLVETDETLQEDAVPLLDCYAAVAEIRKVPPEQLAMDVEENFKRYFLDASSLKVVRS